MSRKYVHRLPISALKRCWMTTLDEVIDGDTVRLRLAHSQAGGATALLHEALGHSPSTGEQFLLRLCAIDAQERGQGELYRQARQGLASLCRGRAKQQVVVLPTAIHGSRLVGLALALRKSRTGEWLDDLGCLMTLNGYAQVRDGFLWQLESQLPGARDRYLSAEAKARKYGLGIWAEGEELPMEYKLRRAKARVGSREG